MSPSSRRAVLTRGCDGPPCRIWDVDPRRSCAVRARRIHRIPLRNARLVVARTGRPVTNRSRLGHAANHKLSGPNGPPGPFVVDSVSLPVDGRICLLVTSPRRHRVGPRGTGVRGVGRSTAAGKSRRLPRTIASSAAVWIDARRSLITNGRLNRLQDWAGRWRAW